MKIRYGQTTDQHLGLDSSSRQTGLVERVQLSTYNDPISMRPGISTNRGPCKLPGFAAS
jgi:hypothetical protein